MAPPKLLVVNFPINLRCYVLLGCRVIHVILAINIGDSAFFDIAALVRQFGGLRHHQQTESIHWPPPNQNPGYATVCRGRMHEAPIAINGTIALVYKIGMHGPPIVPYRAYKVLGAYPLR